ncbi:DUF4363 family protein [Bacillota bacterium LX-D]|nr:DUF4363 family protein [Bacillota bacterium LX-D]
MKKILSLFLTLALAVIMVISVVVVKEYNNLKNDFSQEVKETENLIRSANWSSALDSLNTTQATWKKLRPLMQINIDHDYVNDIENNFTLLQGYLETKEQSSSLATILLIQEFWRSIGEM